MARFTFLLTAGLAATAAAGPLSKRRALIPSHVSPISPPATPSSAPTETTAAPATTTEAPATTTEAPATTTETTATTTIPGPADVCSGDTSSTDGVQKILDDSGAVAWLDIMLHPDILPEGETDWVNKLWLQVFDDDGASPLTGCSKIGSDCIVETACSEYPNAMSYWIFKTVGMLHSKVNTARSNLLWTGWLDGLSIDQIGEDFTPPVPDTSWITWVSAAFTLAGPLLGDAGGITTIAVGAMGQIPDAEDDEDSPKVDTTSVENTLRNLVGGAGENVANILKAATGNGDPSDLLALHSDDTYQHATASFFADNTLLVDENEEADNAAFTSLYDSFTKNLEQKLVDVALKTAWYLLVADRDISEEDCTDHGFLWLEAQSDQFYCFHWTVSDDTNRCVDGDPNTCDIGQWVQSDNFDGGFYDKLEQYGFDLESYYKSLIDCELNGNGDIEMDNIVDGLPRCYYNSFVRSGTWGDSFFKGHYLAPDPSIGEES